MSHLYIHGIAVECSESSWEPVRLGEVVRSLNGMPRSTARVKKRRHTFTTDQGGYALEEAEVMRALIEGEGHSWSFDTFTPGLPSSRKLLATQHGAVSQGFGYHGGSLSFDALGEPVTIWPVDFNPTKHTLLYWLKESGTWVHYLVRITAGPTFSVWRNSVKTDADPNIVYVQGNGDLYLDMYQFHMGTVEVDDLVALPYAVPDAWVSALWKWRSSHAWGALPYVKATGPGVPTSGLTALGQCGTGRRVPLTVAGSHTVGEVFDFTLEGV